MEETTVAVVRVPWGKSPSWLNTTLLLSWGIHRGIGGSLLGTLIGVATLHSTLETSDLGLVLDCNSYSIAASSGGSVVVALGRGTVEIVGIAGVVIVSSGLHIASATVGVAWARIWGSVVPWCISW